MLVLTRKCNESIRIGNDIVISVLESSGGQTKIGISAPRRIPVHREEVYKRIKAENRASLVSDINQPDMLKGLIKGS